MFPTHGEHDMDWQVDDSEVSGPNAYVKVESINEVPGKLRGVSHVFARQVRLATPVSLFWMDHDCTNIRLDL